MRKSKEGYLYLTSLNTKFPFDENPLNEYPRPHLKRDSYLSLNGVWDFKLTKDEELPFSYSEKILVPYAVESSLSGIGKLVKPDDIMFYHKKVTLPDEFLNGILILNFDGIDQVSEIYINNKLVSYSSCPYSRVQVKLDEYKKEFDLTIKVKDYTDTSYYQRGKQTLKTNGWFYTSSSGIYKSVWIEKVDKNYIEDIYITPLYYSKSIEIFVKANGFSTATVYLEGQEYTVEVNKQNKIKLINFHPYNLYDPYLYDIKVKYFDDEITSYFGMKKVEIKVGSNQYQRIFINDQETFLSGILYQGYHYLGNLTPVDNKSLYEDLKKIKEMGFNLVRVHIKIESEIFYYYASKLGLFVMQDFPSGGNSYSFLATVLPRFFPFLSNEKVLKSMETRLGRKNEAGKVQFEKEIFYYVRQLNNHPCNIIYTIFNEGWGEYDPSRIYLMLKEKFPSTLFDTASGWYDAESDFYSIHTYTFPSLKREDKKKRCFIISEMGGIGYKDIMHSLFPGYFAHKKCRSKKALENKIKKLYQKQLLPQKKRGLSLVIYTQFNDCESEYNGLYTFDREEIKVGLDFISEMNREMIEDN